ncbi:hypothetical protein MIMGU_mgv1a024595mg [Erythranthe guttata]|uniref:Peptidase C1A papain C-terminal domain-containing protein n=1 Tax=Erythranthe guttata TaxID=4155 RepID=A0A022R768_ERYGU|nr:hypothetical protein MIMGU_mgv1a024595mg [Erythranthe guttata]
MENGITTDNNYLYEDKYGNFCQIEKYLIQVPPYREDLLMKRVARQPVTVEIDARSMGFCHYSKGVFDGPCGTTPDHIVTIIGYGTTVSGTDYWLVKNSWGRNWGKRGYIRMIRRSKGRYGRGICGLAMRAY